MPAPRLRVVALGLAVIAAAGCRRAAADDLLPPDRPIPAVVDHYVDALLKADAVEAAPPADDFTLVRRLTLDLAGRIPTVAESEAFAASADPDKRAKLVDRLMASPVFAKFQAAQLDAMLNGTVAGDGKRKGSVREYLVAALTDRKPWDRVFRELMLPDAADPKQKGAVDFLKSRLDDTDRLTNDVSVAFFGVNVSCAQCHDHPLVADWTQEHFYGMKSFLARTYDAGGGLGEQPAGLAKYKPTKGAEKTARLMFLTGTTVSTDTARELTKDEAKAGGKKAAKTDPPPPPPAFSARAKLVEVSLKQGESEFFARNIVNRVWHQVFGYGLVMPLDQMHSENPPSHPDLLAWLARDVRDHGYDVPRLVRGLVLSRAYARASTYPSAAFPQPTYFAVARLKPLTPGQLATSLKLAGRDPAEFDKLKPGEGEKAFEAAETSARGFASLIAPPTDDFQVGVGEALLFSNGERVRSDFLGTNGGSMVARATAAKAPAEAVALMVRAVLGRPATDAERDALAAYVAGRSGKPAEAYRDVLWALVTSPEFRFNH